MTAFAAPSVALASAVIYGLVDFGGGVLSRRMHHAVVSMVSQVSAFVVASALAILAGAELLTVTALLWGLLSGIGSGLTMLFLNRGLSRGSMSVVVPLSAVTGIALSVLCGVFVSASPPGIIAWVGIAIVGPALWFVAGGTFGGWSPAVGDALIASVGVAVQYMALAQAAQGSGVWPVAIGRMAAVAIIGIPLLRALPTDIDSSDVVLASLVGAGAAIGLVLYLIATRQQVLTIAVVLASLYPALPVILGVGLLRESLTRRQVIGLLGTATAAVLLCS